MRLAFHIFLKDARRLRYEVAVVGLVTLAMGWTNADGWAHGVPSLMFHQAAFLLQTLSILAWCYLAIAVVQSDPLLGTDEDWMTRPVPRGALAGGKALFALCFLVVPVALAAIVMQARTGLHPLSRPGGLAWYLVGFAAIVVLPAAAVGAVTRGLPAAVLVGLGVLAGIGVSENVVPMRVDRWSVLVWVPLAAVALLGAAGAAAVLWTQYRRGPLRVARGLAVMTLALAIGAQSGLSWEMGYGLQRLVAGGGHEVSGVRVEAAGGIPGPGQNVAQPYGALPGWITLKLKNLPGGHRVRILRVEGVVETGSGRDRLRWMPHPYELDGSEVSLRHLAPGRAKTVTGTVWYELLAPEGREVVRIKADEAVAAVSGRCTLLVEWMAAQGFDPMVTCTWPFRAPRETTVAVESDEWTSQTVLLSGTEAGSPFPAQLGLPVARGVSRLVKGDAFRLKDAAGSARALVFQTWKGEGFYRRDFQLEIASTN